jgi:hypothetical protein
MHAIPTARLALALVACGAASVAQDPKSEISKNQNKAAQAPTGELSARPVALLKITSPKISERPELHPYALMTIDIDPVVTIDSKSFDLRDNPNDYEYKVHWLSNDNPTLPSSLVNYASFDPGASRLVITVVWFDVPGAIVIECNKTVDGKTLLLARSREVVHSTPAKYKISVTPSSAYPDGLVSVIFDPKPDQQWLKNVSVTFSNMRVKPVRDVETTDGEFFVKIPTSLEPNSKPVVQAQFGVDEYLVESLPFERFTVLAPSPTASASPAQGSTSSRLLDWVLPIAALFILAVGIGMISLVYYLRRLQRESAEENDRLRDMLQKGASSISGSVEKIDSDEYLPRDRALGRTPAIPEALSEACASGKCVIVIGNGVAVQAGMPTFHETASRLIELGERRQPERPWDMLKRSNAAGRDGPVGDILRRWCDEQTIFEMMKTAYVRGAASNLEIYRILGLIPAAGFLNWSWDDRFEREVRLSRKQEGKPEPIVLTSSDVSGFNGLSRDRNYFLVNVNGTLDEQKQAAFVFTYEDYRRKAASNLPFAKFVEDCFNNRMILFVGTGLESMEQFLTGLKPQTSADRQSRHFALVRDKHDYEVQSELFRAKYGIESLGFIPTHGYPEVLEFLTNLRNVASRAGEKVEAGASRMPRLEGIKLTNIGAFDAFEIDVSAKKAGQPAKREPKLSNSGTLGASAIDLPSKKDGEAAKWGPSWNVMLGNNGCGKSTLLRAVALGLCGDDREAREAGARLLKTGAASGTIELKFGDRTYKTTLNRDPSGGGVIVQSGLTPLQVERWVALGFPALRGASRNNPSGPGADGRPEPGVRDVLPLLIGNVDWRFDSIKQWIVNTDTKARRDDVPPAEKEKARKMLDTFFRCQRAFVPGVTLDFSRVDKNFTIYVKTSDGEVPIDQLSQGTGSVLGWVGTLLQRMYEIYSSKDEPEKEHALVLIDEIDAHMHPEWQHAVVGAVRKIFPNLQVVATTHSALIVGDLSAGEVTVLRRDEETGKIKKVDAGSQDYHGLRFDQLLTSPLFGLETPRSQTGEDKMRRYQSLKRRAAGDAPPLSAAERTEYELLEQFVTQEINSGETKNQRAIEQGLTAVGKLPLSDMLLDSDITPEQAQAFRERMGTTLPRPSADGRDGTGDNREGRPR